jgi:hypothetical protein
VEQQLFPCLSQSVEFVRHYIWLMPSYVMELCTVRYEGRGLGDRVTPACIKGTLEYVA